MRIPSLLVCTAFYLGFVAAAVVHVELDGMNYEGMSFGITADLVKITVV